MIQWVMDKEVKLKKFEKLEEEGYIYDQKAHRLVVSNNQASWRTFPPDIYSKRIIVADDVYVLSTEEYEAFKELFEDSTSK